MCVVSGRDRRVVQELMGLDDLVVAGSHGFDMWSPGSGSVESEEGVRFDDLIERVTARAALALLPMWLVGWLLLRCISCGVLTAFLSHNATMAHGG